MTGSGSTPASPGYDLARFVEAQDDGGVFSRAMSEVRSGRKSGHWMWFVYPQLRGLGFSATARFYGVESLGEARAYLGHPVLGPRIVEAATMAAEVAAAPDAPSAAQVFGSIDAVKLRSSMTLFARADPGRRQFVDVLERWFGGGIDPATDALLEGSPDAL